jgi:hypothetical protein
MPCRARPSGFSTVKRKAAKSFAESLTETLITDTLSPMKKTMTFQWTSDPGHAWLKVKESLIDQLGIASKISCYSYRDGQGEAYLEEDLDAEVFLSELRKHGVKVSTTVKRVEHAGIRYLNSFVSRNK